MQLQVSGKGASPIEVSDQKFACEYKEALVHQVITAYLAKARQGTKAQKSRSDVSGGGAKPWRQKGTGRARAGTTRGPIWRTGGVTFAARPRNFEQKVNKKMYRAALASIFSELVRQERLVVVKELAFEKPKTSELAKLLKAHELDNVLIVTEGENRNVSLSGRNLQNVQVCAVERLDLVGLISFEKVLMTPEVVKKIEETLL